MGVSLLRRDVLKNYSKPVQIASVVRKYKEETGSQDAVAVVDGNNTMWTLTHELDFKCGGRFKELSRRVETMINAFADIGLTTVWFFDGNDDDHRREHWIEKKRETQRRIQVIYQSQIEPGHRKVLRVQPAGLWETLTLTLKEMRVEIHLSPEDGDLDIARYARDNDAFCILSADMDFVLLPGARYLLSGAEYDASPDWSTTVMFDREEIRKGLGLASVDELALLGALLPNDYIDTKLLSEFYRVKNIPVASLDISTLVQAVTRFIGELSNLPKDGKVASILEDLPTALSQKLNISIKMYDYLQEDLAGKKQSSRALSRESRVVELAREKLYEAECLPELHMVVAKRILEMSPCLENPSLPESGRSRAALQPLRARVYGLLQITEPVTEWYASSKRERTIRSEKVAAICFGSGASSNVSPVDLWTKDKVPVCKKWQLMSWALTGGSSEQVTASRMLGRLQEEMVAPAATLMALHQSKALEVLSLPAEENLRKLALACAACLDRKAVNPRSQPCSDESMHLAAFFMRTFTHVLLLNDAMGQPVPRLRMNPSIFFDGPVFQALYGEGDNKILASETFKLLINTALLRDC